MVLVVMAIVNRIRREKELTESVKKSFGVAPTDSMTLDRYASLPAYLKSLPEAEGDIDDITWNDLDMDRIFESLNHTGSAVGAVCRALSRGIPIPRFGERVAVCGEETWGASVKSREFFIFQIPFA